MPASGVSRFSSSACAGHRLHACARRHRCTRVRISTPSPGPGHAQRSPSARSRASSMPRPARYCGPLSAAGNSRPAQAKRCSDAASDSSGSVSPEANSYRSSLSQQLDDLRRVPQPAAARDFHRDAVQHAERHELLRLDRRDDALVHQDRQRALAPQRLVIADAVGRQRRFERLEAGVGELRPPCACAVARSKLVLASAQWKPLRRELAHRAHQLRS